MATSKIGFNYSQDDEMTKISIVLPTQIAKTVFRWIVLPIVSSSILWSAGAWPIGQNTPTTSLPPVAEQTRPYQ